MRDGRFRIDFEDDLTVRVPDVVLRSVAFIGDATDEESVGLSGDLRGTGFFVCVPFKSSQLSTYRMAYFVTAGHVAKALSDKWIYFLVNKRGGGITTMVPLSTHWLTHPTDKTADVAVLPLELNPDADIKCISLMDNFVRPFDFNSQNVGVGDEVFITGLFTQAPGQSRLMPIVRHGNIAMLPTEQIQTELGYADVYLVEARSIGGLSGSPVFVRSADFRSEGLDSTRGMKLLGLMHGHWDIRESEMNKPSIIHDRQRGVNLGIAMVVPSDKIWETINSPHSTEWMNIMESKHMERSQRGIPGTDLAEPKVQTKDDLDNYVFTKEDFDDALRKVTRKKPDES